MLEDGEERHRTALPQSALGGDLHVLASPLSSLSTPWCTCLAVCIPTPSSNLLLPDGRGCTGRRFVTKKSSSVWQERACPIRTDNNDRATSRDVLEGEAPFEVFGPRIVPTPPDLGGLGVLATDLPQELADRDPERESYTRAERISGTLNSL